QALELGILLRADFPGAGREDDVDELDMPQPLAQLVVVADFLERIGTLEALDRGGVEGLVEVVVARAIVVDDVFLAGDGNPRRRHVENDEPDRADADADGDVAQEAAVVDDVMLPTVRSAPVAPHEAPVGVDLREDAHAVGARIEGGDDAVGPPFRLRARAAPEPLGLVVADDGPVVLLDDDAIARLLDDPAIALDALLAALLHLIEAPRARHRRHHARGGRRRTGGSGRRWGRDHGRRRCRETWRLGGWSDLVGLRWRGLARRLTLG